MKPLIYLTTLALLLFIGTLIWSSKTTYSDYDYIPINKEKALDMRWGY